MVGGSGSGKKNALLNLIYHEPDIDNKILYAKDHHKAKYQSLINKRKSSSLRYFNDSKAFIECLNNLDNIVKTLKNTTQIKKLKVLIFFDDMIVYMLSNKKT